MSYSRLWNVPMGGLIVPSSYVPPGVTNQRNPIPGHLERMVRNHAGGFAFRLDPWEALERFLVLGSESGTYYVQAPALTRENTKNLIYCTEIDGPRVVRTVAVFDQERRCPKRSPLLWALAVGSIAPFSFTRHDAFRVAEKVVRTGTDLFEFVAYREALGGGWGRSMRRFVTNWYESKDPEQLVYQLLKYKQRNGWSHRDLLRLAKPVPKTAARDALYRYAVGKGTEYHGMPTVVALTLAAHEYAHAHPDSPDIGLIADPDVKLSWEMLPTQWLATPHVWETLVRHDRLPPTALLRNLGRMTAVGASVPYAVEELIVDKFRDEGWVKNSKLHPVSILNAWRVYAKGRGEKGHLTWSPAPSITGALERAFQLSFSNVRPIDKKLLVALDVSGSMTGEVNGMAGLSALDAGMVLAKALLLQATGSSFVVFDTAVAEVKGLEKQHSLPDMQKLCRESGVWNGGTDVAQPLLHELVLTDKGKGHDAVVILTDGETWAGDVHVSQVWGAIRQLNPQAKLVLAAMTATGTTLASPFDSNTLNAIGLDAGLLQVVEQFVGGNGAVQQEDD